MSGEVVLPKAEELPIAVLKNGTYRIIGNYKAIVSEAGRVYAVVTSKYNLVQHKDVIEITDRILKEYGIKPIKKWIELTKDGSRLFYSLVFKPIEVSGDRIYLGLRITNSYDASMGIHINGYGFRLACKNQMVFDNRIAGEYAKHFRSIAEFGYEELKKKIEKVLEALEVFKDVILMAQKRTLTASEILRFIDEELKPSKALKRKILLKVWAYTGVNLEKEAEREVNVWQAYNGITDTLTHHAKLNPASIHELQKKASVILVQSRRR